MELCGTTQKQLSAFPFHCSFNEKFAEVQLPSVNSSSSQTRASEYHIPHVSLQNKAKTYGKAAISQAALAQAGRGGIVPLGRRDQRQR